MSEPNTNSTPSTPAPSIRETLVANIDKATPPQSAPATPPVSTPEAPPEPAGRPGQPRAPDGKYAARAPTQTPASTPSAPAEPGKPPGTEGPPPVAPAHKPPQSLPPAVREAWGALSPAAQEALLKREGEVSNNLRASAESRKFQQQFSEVVKPYAAKFTAPPLERVATLLHTADTLQYGQPHEKVELFAQMMEDFGLDPEALATRLESGRRAPPPYRDPRVDQLMRRLEEQDERRAHDERQQLHRQVEDFGQKNPHFEKVRGRMADLYEASVMRDGVEPDFATLYDEACWSHPEVRKELMAQQQAQGTASAATQRAKDAVSSVRTNPAPTGGQKQPTSIRGLLEAQWEDR